MSRKFRTPKEVAYEMDVSETCVYRWCQSGYLPSYKVGGRWRISNEKNADIEDSEAILRQIQEGMKKSGW